MSNSFQSATDLFATQSNTGQLALLGIVPQNGLLATQKSTIESNSGWTSVLPVNIPGGLALNSPSTVRGGLLPDKWLQLFALDSSGTRLLTAWQTVPLGTWYGWQIFNLPPGVNSALQIEVLRGEGGQLFLFLIDSNHQLWFCNKQSTDENALWTAWQFVNPGSTFQAYKITSSLLANTVAAIAVTDQNGIVHYSEYDNPNWTALHPFPAPENDTLNVISLDAVVWPDGTVQLWAVGTSLPNSQPQVFTCWQKTPTPLSSWFPWILDTTNQSASLITGGSLSDGRFQLWIVDPSGNLLSKWSLDQTGYDLTGWSAFP